MTTRASRSSAIRREDLDAVSTEHLIVLMHISSHFMTGNSRLFEEIGVNAGTADPEGGKFVRKPGSRESNGVMEETAVLAVAHKLPAPTPEQAMEMLDRGLRFYAAAGITTAQDGGTGAGAAKLLAAMAKAGKLPIDVVGYPMYKTTDDKLFDTVASERKTPGRFRLGGIKLTVDGAIQGYTAYLSKPITSNPEPPPPFRTRAATRTPSTSLSAAIRRLRAPKLPPSRRRATAATRA